jgi:hypothetical protein
MPKGVALLLTLSLTVIVMLVFASMIAWALSASWCLPCSSGACYGAFREP